MRTRNSLLGGKSTSTKTEIQSGDEVCGMGMIRDRLAFYTRQSPQAELATELRGRQIASCEEAPCQDADDSPAKSRLQRAYEAHQEAQQRQLRSRLVEAPGSSPTGYGILVSPGIVLPLYSDTHRGRGFKIDSNGTIYYSWR